MLATVAVASLLLAVGVILLFLEGDVKLGVGGGWALIGVAISLGAVATIKLLETPDRNIPFEFRKAVNSEFDGPGYYCRDFVFTVDLRVPSLVTVKYSSNVIRTRGAASMPVPWDEVDPAGLVKKEEGTYKHNDDTIHRGEREQRIDLTSRSTKEHYEITYRVENPPLNSVADEHMRRSPLEGFEFVVYPPCDADRVDINVIVRKGPSEKPLPQPECVGGRYRLRYDEGLFSRQGFSWEIKWGESG